MTMNKIALFTGWNKQQIENSLRVCDLRAEDVMNAFTTKDINGVDTIMFIAEDGGEFLGLNINGEYTELGEY